MTNEKQKVVHVITKLELGGAQVNTIYTVEHLDDSRFETYLITGPGGILTDKVERKDRFIVLDNLVRPIHPIKDGLALVDLVRVLKTIKPDIVHTHSSKAGILGRMAAGLAGVPVIVHSVHGFSFSPFQSFLKRMFYTTAEKMISQVTDHFIFVSTEDVETAKACQLVRNNYSLIRSGFPFTHFTEQNADSTAIRSTYGIKDSDFVCGIIAPFKPQKGLCHLIEIASEVLRSAEIKKNIVFMIMGDGALRPSIESALNERGIRDHFRLPGFVFDIHRAIDVCDLGISTALWEGLPQSLVQLRLKRKAVVASDISGNREIVKHGKNGFLVNVFDYQTFAQRILELVTDDDTRERMANFEEDFSEWDAAVMVRKQEELYRKLSIPQQSS
ncbi:MAG: glycosyltransferase [Candidatus Omnitrophota bacterium]